MGDEYFIIIGVGLGLIAFLLAMLIPVSGRSEKKDRKNIRGYCPVCGHELYKGERIRSNVVEIGNMEIRTYIKGCPYCLGMQNRKRICPVCKEKLPKDKSIMAVSDPKGDTKKLSIRGCEKCYPQGFD